MADSSKKNEPGRAHDAGDSQHDGFGDHHVAYQHGSTGCRLAVVVAFHGNRLDGHRLLFCPVRRLLLTLWRVVRLHRRGSREVGFFFLCSYLYFLSLAIANVAVAISAVGYMTAFLPWLGSGAIPLCIGTIG